MACDFEQGEQFDPRYSRDIRRGEVPLESCQKNMYLDELGLMSGMSMFTVGERAKDKNPASTAVPVDKLAADLNLRHFGLALA